jgi:hypothetical protein
MEIERIFWEKATAAHVYCVQGEAGLSQRFSRHFYDLARLDEAGYLPSVLKAREIAEVSLATWLGPLRRFVLAHPLGR